MHVQYAPTHDAHGRPGSRALPRAGFFAALLLLAQAAGAVEAIHLDEHSFDCISKLTAVRGFFVGNVLGNTAATLKVARSHHGGVYPPGSVVQLVPTEVMVKQRPGFNPLTHDWEFIELDVSKAGTKIRGRGFADVVNRFGGNCFGCHIRAKPQWDLICETGHGCEPIPLTPAMLGALQRTDPRCPNAEHVSAEDQAALKELGALLSPKPAADAGH
jgi:hypothetical protein